MRVSVAQRRVHATACRQFLSGREKTLIANSFSMFVNVPSRCREIQASGNPFSPTLYNELSRSRVDAPD
jgi:hypothetical protein